MDGMDSFHKQYASVTSQLDIEYETYQCEV